MLYVRNTEPAARTNTNEIAHWTDHFEAQFGTPFYVFGFYRDRELVGFAEAAFLASSNMFAFDYLILDEAHRRNNVFYEFVDHLKRYLEKRHPEYQFGVLETPYGAGEDHPSPEAQLLIRLMKLQGFHVVHAPYYQPRLRLEDAESEMRADLLVYSPAKIQSLKTDTYLAMVRSIYYEYYLPWKSLLPERQDAYREHLDRLFRSISTSVQGKKSVTVNGHKTLLSAPERQRPMTVHRIVMFGLQASLVTLLLTASMLGLKSAFGLSNASFAGVFLLALGSFVALAGIVSKDARDVLAQLLVFAKDVMRLRSKSEGLLNESPQPRLPKPKPRGPSPPDLRA